MGDNAIDGEDREDGEALSTDKEPMLNTLLSHHGPSFASSQCVAIASCLINEHKHVQVSYNICNFVHVCSLEYFIALQGSSG